MKNAATVMDFPALYTVLKLAKKENEDENNNIIATLSKHVINLFDVYTLNINDPKDALDIMLLAIAIDMEKANQ